MAALLNAAAAGVVIAACLVSPERAPPDGTWTFIRDPTAACLTSAGPAADGLTLAFIGRPGMGDEIAARLSSDRPFPPIPPGTLGNLELPGAMSYAVRVEEVRGKPGQGDEIRLSLPDLPRLLADLAGSDALAERPIWLDLPGVVTTRFPATDWRAAMRRLADCAA